MIQNEPSRQDRPLSDPALATANPQETLHHPALTRKEKIELLRSRQYDAAEIAVAEKEGMQVPEKTRCGTFSSRWPNWWNTSQPVTPTQQHGHS